MIDGRIIWQGIFQPMPLPDEDWHGPEHRLFLSIADMANTTIFSATVQWTPPSAPVNSGQSVFSLQLSYNAQNVGTIDVPDSTAPATVYDIPFGAVSKAKMLIVKNFTALDLDLSINASADLISIPPSGMVMFGAPIDPTGPSDHPIESASLKTRGTSTSLARAEFWVFGD